MFDIIGQFTSCLIMCSFTSFLLDDAALGGGGDKEGVQAISDQL